MKKLIPIISLFCFAFSFNCRSQITPTYSNVDYVGNGNPKQMLDIYIPPGTSAKKALVVHIHGGGWKGGGKNLNTQPYFQGIYNAGYICVDINYRLSSDSLFPAQIQDCKTAIRFLKTNAAQYFIDTCNVGLIGGSAGGHLVSLLATSYGVSAFEGRHLGSNTVSSKVHAVVSLFGIYDFLSADSQSAQSCTTSPLVHDAPGSPETLLLGCQISVCPAKSNAANPINYISSDDPPFYLAHGTKDCTTPYGQSNEFYNALISGNVVATVTLMVGATHASTVFVTPAQETIYTNFFNSKLINSCPVATGITENTIVDLEIFPNPANAILSIKPNTNSSKEIFVEIYNAIGALALSTQINAQDNKRTELNISSLSPGIYILKTNAGKGFSTKKLIVN